MKRKRKGSKLRKAKATKMENFEIARILKAYADLLDIKSDNPFRVRSYRKAAQSLENMSRPVAELFEEELPPPHRARPPRHRRARA